MAAGSLPDIGFKISYGPADDRLHDFYIPALSRSVRYDRAAGYFSSSALAIAAAGVARLIENNGTMRLLVGASLDPDDVVAIQKGHELADKVSKALERNWEDPEDALQQQRLEVLAWMVSEGKLQIKVVLPTDADGHPFSAEESDDYYHPKAGIFTDAEGNQVAFNGSINESARGWKYNYEQFAVYRSWDTSKPYLSQEVIRFQRLWEGTEQDWVAMPIPEAAQKKLLRYKPDKAPIQDPLERDVSPTEELDKELQRERIIARFIRDAPYFPNGHLLGLVTSTVTPWPHQRRVADTLVERFPESFLLCDEVGLGKTIEAGLALRQLIISSKVQRILLLAPKSIARQWQEELYEKVLLNIPVYDGSTFTDYFKRMMSPDAENHWNAFPLMISSSQLAKRRDRQPELLASEHWDLIIVDEAHHARRKEFLSERYRPNRLLELLSRLKDRTKALWLLTATPMQIDPVEVWDLLKLLGLGGCWGAAEDNFLEFFGQLRQDFDEVDWDFVFTMVKDFLDTDGGLDPLFEEQAEESLGVVEWHQIRDLPHSTKRQPIIRQLSSVGRAVVKEFAKRHTPLRRMVFRNTRELMHEYQRRGLLKERVPRRDPKPEWVSMTDSERELYERIEEYISDFYQKYEAERKGLGFIMTVYRRRLTSSFYALERSLKRRLAYLQGEVGDVALAGLDDDDLEQEDLSLDITEEIPEELQELFIGEVLYIQDFLRDLRNLGSDSKLEQLMEDLRQLFQSRDTVIIFTQYADTMDYLRDALRLVYGGQVACYSGRGGEVWDGAGWVRTTKEYIKTKFREGEEIKILLCTEAASEGLNLQTCGVLVNYDMPWNPMRVEQRIGRIDRIGQQYEVVWVRNYFYEGTVEAHIYRRLSDRIDWFETVVGELQPILARVARSIQTVVMTPSAERERRLDEEIEALRRAVAARGAEFLQLNEHLEGETFERAEEPVPVSLRELEEFFLHSRSVGEKFQPHPVVHGAYLLAISKEQEVGVTFDPDLFDRYPDSLRLLSFKEELFEQLLEKFGFPAKSDIDSGLVRYHVKSPVMFCTYYGVDEKSFQRLDSLEGFKQYLDSVQELRLPTENVLESARQDFESLITNEADRLEKIEDAQERGRVLALREEVRRLLLKAALIEIALAQHQTMFDEQVFLDFNEEAILQLKRHKYPFTGLIRKLTEVGALQGLRPSPTDSFYLRIKDQRPELLRRRFEGIRETAEKLLSAIASTTTMAEESLSDTDDLFIAQADFFVF